MVVYYMCDSGEPVDKANVSDVHPNHKNDHYDEWNAIKETFSGIPAGKVSREKP